MNARDISCNCLWFIYGLELFVESLQTEYFKSFSFCGRNPRLGLPFITTLISARVGLKVSSALLPFLKTYSRQYTLPSFLMVISNASMSQHLPLRACKIYRIFNSLCNKSAVLQPGFYVYPLSSSFIIISSEPSHTARPRKHSVANILKFKTVY